MPRGLLAAGLLAGLVLLGPEKAAAEDCGKPPANLATDCLQPDSKSTLFGTAVAVSRDQRYVVVGAPGGQGTATVFFLTIKSTGALSNQPFPLKTPSSLPKDAAFGQSVAISKEGNVVAIGAPRAAVRGTSSGAVYLYKRSGELSWDLIEQPVVGEDTNAFDLFGFAVALSDEGDTLLVGAPLHDAPNGLGNSGAAYVFHLDEGVWSQQRELTAAEAEADDQLGFSVALDAEGTSFLVGAPQTRLAEPNLGKVYLFDGDSDKRMPIAKGPSEAPVNKDLLAFGFSVSLRGDGEAALVGAPGASKKQGAAYLLMLMRENWMPHNIFESHPDTVQPSTGAEFGFAVAIDNSVRPPSLPGPSIAVGARRDQCSNSGSVGAVYLFQNDMFLDRVCGPRTGAELGSAVSVRGGTYLVGIPHSTSQGSAQVLAVTSDLSIELERLAETVAPGKAADYRLTVRNEGKINVARAQVILTFSQKVDSLTGFGNTPETGSSFETTVDLGAKGTPTETKVFNLGVKIDPSATGDLKVTAEVVPPDTVRDPDDDDNDKDSDTVPLEPQTSLIVSIEVTPNPIVPGRPATYKVQVTNQGPSTARDVTLDATIDSFLPQGVVTKVMVSCDSPHLCAASGTKVPQLPPKASAFFTIVATTNPAATGNLVFTATISRREGGEVLPRPTLTTPLTPQANVYVASFEGPRQAVPGNPLPIVYTLVVTNDGPSDVRGGTVRTIVSSDLEAVIWRCTTTPLRDGFRCQQTETHGNIFDTIDLPAKQSLTYTLTATVEPSVATTLLSKAFASAPEGVEINHGCNPRGRLCEEKDVATPVTPVADLSITVGDKGNVVPGNPLPQSFTVTVSNAGPSDVRKARVRSIFSPDLASVTWTCAALNGSCTPSDRGNLDDQVSLRVGGKLTYTIHFVVGAGATGTLVNKASVEPGDPDPGNAPLTDPRSANNNAEGQITLKPVSDLAIARHEGPKVVIPGNPLPAIYIFDVTNAGPSDARGVRVRHGFTPDLATVTWTCMALNASCVPSGTGEIQQPVTLRAGGRLTYTVKALAEPGMPAGNLKVLAEVFFVSADAGSDPRHANDRLAVEGVQITPVADLSITATVDRTQAIPGDSLSLIYTLRVANAGPSDVRDALVSDTFPSQLTKVAWTCAALRGSCTPSGNGHLNDHISLRAGGTLTYTVKAVVDAAAIGSLSNKASVEKQDLSIDPRTGNNTAMAPDVRLTPVADLALTLKNNTNGNNLEYLIYVTNAGPSDIRKAKVTETFTVQSPPSSLSWSCTALLGSCSPSGVGALSGDQVSLRVGGTLTYRVTGTVTSSGTTVVEVSLDPTDGTDPRQANNSATVEIVNP